MKINKGRNRRKEQSRYIPKAKSWGTNSKHYQSKAWREFRETLKREHINKYGNLKCVMCNRAGITEEATVLDHIKPVPANATVEVFWAYSTRENVQWLCAGHNNQKSNK